MIDLLIDWISF